MNSTGAPLDSEVDCELSAFEGVDCVPAVDCVLPDSEGGLLLHAEKSVAARINAIYVVMMTSPFRADVSKLNASTDSHLTLRSKVTGIATRHSLIQSTRTYGSYSIVIFNANGDATRLSVKTRMR